MKRSFQLTLLFVLLSSFLLAASFATEISWVKHTIGDNFQTLNTFAIDMDSDGDVDILGTAHSEAEIAWWENDGAQNFTKYIIDDNFVGAFEVLAAYIDTDGYLDVLGVATWAPEIAWWDNDGNQNFTKHTLTEDFLGSRDVDAFDLDDDGDIDILGAALEAAKFSWWENDGNQPPNFTEHPIATGYSCAHEITAAYINDDQYLDILTTAFHTGKVSWWENDGNQNFTERIISSSIGGANSICATDLDGDDDTDILCSSNWDYTFYWWENDGNENFTERKVAEDLVSRPVWVYAIDLDDDDDDVDVLGNIDSRLLWFENDGYQNFTEHIISECNTGFHGYAKDIDGDGDTDVLLGTYDPPEIVWWEQRRGVIISADLACLPSTGTVPFTTKMTVTLTNHYTGHVRTIAGHIDATLANAQFYANWRDGYFDVAAGGSYVTVWGQNIPALPSVIGNNVFTMIAEDVTPAPYNQPPYPAAGDTATSDCTVTGIAPLI